jgi:hypothetical protein
MIVWICRQGSHPSALQMAIWPEASTVRMAWQAVLAHRDTVGGRSAIKEPPRTDRPAFP